MCPNFDEKSEIVELTSWTQRQILKSLKSISKYSVPLTHLSFFIFCLLSESLNEMWCRNQCFTDKFLLLIFLWFEELLLKSIIVFWASSDRENGVFRTLYSTKRRVVIKRTSMRPILIRFSFTLFASWLYFNLFLSFIHSLMITRVSWIEFP
jgi:hypothetical protein